MSVCVRVCLCFSPTSLPHPRPPPFPSPQGMGKTVITLSLILANPAPEKGSGISEQAAADHWGAVAPGQVRRICPAWKCV